MPSLVVIGPQIKERGTIYFQPSLNRVKYILLDLAFLT